MPAASGLLALALLVSEAALAALVYTSVHVAFGTLDAIVMFAAFPAIGLGLCLVLLVLAIKASMSGAYRLGVAWAVGSSLGMFGFWLALAVGPHLAGFYLWFLLLQVFIFLAKHIARIWRQRSVSHARNA